MRKRKVFVAGHRGMVGAAIVRALEDNDEVELVTRTSHDVDLREQGLVREFFQHQRIDEVYLAAAKVGGIHANNAFPATFIFDNLMIQTNVIDAAFRSGVKRLLFLGSSCIYPRLADQPMKEQALLTGPLEPTNEPYAIAKITGIKMCESYNRQFGESHGIDYRCIMPTNLYGPGDNYHGENSHVIPALIRRFHEAKVGGSSEVVVWGSGGVRREFLYVDDLAAAALKVMQIDRAAWGEMTSAMCSHVNVGSGDDVTIRELAELIARVVGFEGKIIFDAARPDGAPRKLMDSELIQRMGWSPMFELEAGLRIAYHDFQHKYGAAKS